MTRRNSRCESYNTAQHRLLHGDILESPEQDFETRHIIASRARSSSHGADEAISEATAPLRINTSSPQPETGFPQQSAPSPANLSGRFLSYSLTRDRAVSPVVSNYFGLPPNRDSERPIRSTSFFGGRLRRDPGDDHGGELRLWGTKLKYSYGFLSRETESADGASDAEGAVESSDGNKSEEDEQEEDEQEEDEQEEDEQEEDDEEEDDDHEIDIFGHR